MPYARIDYSLDMYYDDDDFTDPWRPSETVVLHHGNAKNARLWYAWVPLLARQYRIVRLDARGFGRSSLPPEGYRWSLGRFAADLRGLLDHLGLERVHLIGETVGGTIALQFAADYPDRLHSVTTCTSPYKFAGNPGYGEARDLVRDAGVEAWVRQTAGRRLDPGRFRCGASGMVHRPDGANPGAGGDGNFGLSVAPGFKPGAAPHPDAGAGAGVGGQRAG